MCMLRLRVSLLIALIECILRNIPPYIMWLFLYFTTFLCRLLLRMLLKPSRLYVYVHDDYDGGHLCLFLRWVPHHLLIMMRVSVLFLFCVIHLLRGLPLVPFMIIL